MPNSDKTKKETVVCPSCKQLVNPDNEHYPFCNARCRQADLGKWLNGDYVISRPLEQADFEED